MAVFAPIQGRGFNPLAVAGLAENQRQFNALMPLRQQETVNDAARVMVQASKVRNAQMTNEIDNRAVFSGQISRAVMSVPEEERPEAYQRALRVFSNSYPVEVREGLLASVPSTYGPDAELQMRGAMEEQEDILLRRATMVHSRQPDFNAATPEQQTAILDMVEQVMLKPSTQINTGGPIKRLANVSEKERLAPLVGGAFNTERDSLWVVDTEDGPRVVDIDINPKSAEGQRQEKLTTQGRRSYTTALNMYQSMSLEERRAFASQLAITRFDDAVLGGILGNIFRKELGVADDFNTLLGQSLMLMLRDLTGAAQTDTELKRTFNQFLPQIFEDPEETELKLSILGDYWHVADEVATGNPSASDEEIARITAERLGLQKLNRDGTRVEVPGLTPEEYFEQRAAQMRQQQPQQAPAPQVAPQAGQIPGQLQEDGSLLIDDAFLQQQLQQRRRSP